jgi:DDE superfamily endonuclease
MCFAQEIQGVVALTAPILAVLGIFASEFSVPTWKNIQVLLIGAILCRGPRRISCILRVMGLASISNFSKYHRVLSRAEWNSLVLAKILLGLLLQLLPASWPILIAVDETLERRRGKKIKAKGLYRDAVQSSQSHVVTSFGLKWECMMLIVPLPWCKRPWALPFLTLLAPSKKSNEKIGRRHKTSLDWTRQMMKLVSRWLRRHWILIGDGAYACMDLATACIKQNVTLISRLRLDAQLFEFPVYEEKKLGRKRIKGNRIHLKKFLSDTEQIWQTGTVDWYGGEKKTIEYITFICLWYHPGVTPIPLRIVLVKTPKGKSEAETFFSTDVHLEPVQLINYFVLRWNIEVTFEETRAHLGVETQRQWSDKAIARSTPLLMGLYSFVTLVAVKMHQIKKLTSLEIASWYDKKGELTFSDILAAVRRDIWFQKNFSKSENKPDLRKCSDKAINSLIYQLSMAA